MAEKKRINEEIEIPEGINIEVEREKIKLEKGNESAEKVMPYPFKIEDRKIIFSSKGGKKDKKLIKTSIAHIRNLVSGLQERYIYKLQICSVHFPMNVSLRGQELIIKNFLGEVKERKARILDGVNVKIDKEIITLESSDKEKAGQTAANIENTTRIRKRDRRVFQDGIFIVEKEKGRRKNEF